MNHQKIHIANGQSCQNRKRVSYAPETIDSDVVRIADPKQPYSDGQITKRICIAQPRRNEGDGDAYGWGGDILNDFPGNYNDGD
jgi:hypothetical protein